MSLYIYLAAALVASVPSLTYAKWLWLTAGNKQGAIGVYLLTLLGVALPVYRILQAP